MAKKAKKGKGTAGVATKRQKSKPEAKTEREAPRSTTKPERQSTDLDALRKPVLAAKAKLETEEAEAKQVAEKARTVVAAAKQAYREALQPYRQACSKAGVGCEFAGGRSANVSAKVSIEIIERSKDGFTLMVKGRPETKERIPMQKLRASVHKAAYEFTDKHVGPRERVGNKGGTLANRLRAAMGSKKQ